MRLYSRRDWAAGRLGARCAPAVCASLSALRVRLPCRDAELVCAAMRFCCRVLSSVHARRCGSVVAFCPPFTPAVCASLSVLCVRLPCRDAELVCAAMRFCCRVLSSVHACLFSFVRKKETACDALRFYSAGRDRHSCVLAVLARLSASVGSLRACAFLYGDLDGLPGTRGYEETGLAARRLCAFAQPHWHCCAFRREYVGAARPKPAPKSLRLSGLSSRCGGVMLVQIPIPAKSASAPISAPTLAKPGYTERPARL